jgi:hypothetical protein
VKGKIGLTENEWEGPLPVMANPPGKSGDGANDKEARLAAALRTNLRRRKAAARVSAPKQRQDDDQS